MANGKTQTLQIRTPEGIVFSLFLASPVTRCLAWLIDFFCLLAAFMILSNALLLLGVISLDLMQALRILAYFVIQIGYGIVMEWFWRGQTLGKRMLRLRVVDANGLRLQFSQVVIRNLLRFVDMLPAAYFLGGITCLVNRRGQRLGDLAANTVVIRNPQIINPDLDQVLSGAYNSLRAHPHLEARLRQRVSPTEAAVALRAVLRRDELDPAARVELFAEIAEHFRSLVEFPPDTIEGIGDEQYVRNVVDSIFRTHREETRSTKTAIAVEEQAAR